MTDPPDPITAEDRELFRTLAGRLGMTEWPGDPDTLVAVGDGETFYELVRDEDQVAFAEVRRGHRVVEVRFDTAADAARYLAFVLSGRWLARPREFAPDTTYTPDGPDRVLRWPGGRATSPAGRLSTARARAFSWVATATPQEIADRGRPR